MKKDSSKTQQHRAAGVPHKTGAGSGRKNTNTANFDLKIGKTTLHLSNQDKIYWPKEKYTKGDLVNYYNQISGIILPYLEDRPQSMHRYPNGIKGSAFFQKDVSGTVIPDWVKTEEIFSVSNNEKIKYLVCNDRPTLLYMANLGCIEINPWSSRIFKPNFPDWLVIDLDPANISFEEVVKTARMVKKVLDKLELTACVKTSGATGLHIFIPLGAQYDYPTVKTFAHLVANMVHDKVPQITSLVRMPAKRNKKVYLDFLQNNFGQTIAAPYSVRPRAGAPVSTPLKWNELTSRLDPTAFTIKTIFKRLDKVGDLWEPVIGKGENIMGALKKIQDQPPLKT